jgi:hypothetical protein
MPIPRKHLEAAARRAQQANLVKHLRQLDDQVGRLDTSSAAAVLAENYGLLDAARRRVQSADQANNVVKHLHRLQNLVHRIETEEQAAVLRKINRNLRCLRRGAIMVRRPGKLQMVSFLPPTDITNRAIAECLAEVECSVVAARNLGPDDKRRILEALNLWKLDPGTKGS